MSNHLRVLVVDDDALVRNTLDRALKRRGHAVVIATAGEQALTLLDGQPYHLVISDVMMPGLDGLDLCRRIRALDPGLPVVLISGLASERMAHQAREAGAAALLPKPITPALLDQALAAAREEIPSSPPQEGAPCPPRPPSER